MVFNMYRVGVLVSVALLILVSSIYTLSYANPIPVPTIIMPNEYISILFRESGGRYYADVYGVYPFENVGYKSITMYYPIPNNSLVTVWIDGKLIEWKYTDKTYHTVIGDYKMISWTIENPPEEFTIKVQYSHELEIHDGSILFLYALGTGKYLEYYAKQTVAYINISSTFSVNTYRVYFDNELNKSIDLSGKPIFDKIVVKSRVFRPLTKDLVIRIEPSELGKDIIFKTDKKVYSPGEPIKIMLYNNMESSIYLPNSAPWGIKDAAGFTIYSPISLQVVTEVKPGEVKVWIWDQRDNMGNYVGPGIYYAYIEILEPRKTLYTSFEITTLSPPTYPVNIPGIEGELYIKVYPDKVRLNYKGLINPYQKGLKPLSSMLFKYNTTTDDNISKISFIMNIRLDSSECKRLPINKIHAYYSYLNGSGEGFIKAFFNATEDFPLNNMTIMVANLYNTTLNATDIDISFSIYFSISHMTHDQVNEIEYIVMMINNPIFQDKIKNEIYEESGGAIELRYIKDFTFDRESGLLNGSIGLRIYNLAVGNLTILPYGYSEEFKKYLTYVDVSELYMFYNVTEYVKLKSLNVTLDYDSSLCTLNISGDIEVEGDINKYVNMVKNSMSVIYIPSYHNLNLHDIFSNIAEETYRDLYIDVSNSYALIKYPVDGRILVDIGGIYVTYLPDPEKTYDVIKDILYSSKDSMSSNFKVVLTGGSSSKLDVALSHSSLGVVKGVTLTKSNITMIPKLELVIGPNKYGIADYKIITKNISIDGRVFTLTLATNSTVREVKSVEDGVIIKVSGRPGLIGALNITISKPEGVSKDNVKVYVDNEEVDAIITEVGNQLNIYVEYMHSTHVITIKWSRPINYLTYIALILVAVAIVIGIILYRRRVT